MTDPLACIDATWPAAACHMAGGFMVRKGLGGGSRVSSASLAAPVDQCDIDAAICQHRVWAQRPVFMLRPEDTVLDKRLAARGFEVFDPVIIYAGNIADLATVEPDASWPPADDIALAWNAGGIGPERLAIMARAKGPGAVLSCRVDGRPAALAFVARHDDTVMLHAMLTVPHFRRRGLGRTILMQAASWAKNAGAQNLALVVTRANAAANALYAGFGMRPVSHYHYRREAT